jgi:hypothetical protein
MSPMATQVCTLLDSLNLQTTSDRSTGLITRSGKDSSQLLYLYLFI